MNPNPKLLVALLLLAPSLRSAETLIFQDDFNRSLASAAGDSPGNGWTTNSKARAKGHQQVDLRQGAMHIFMHPEADHAVSVVHAAEFTHGRIALRFMLEDARDSLGLDFADPQCKEVHAGHLLAVRVSPKQVLLQDLKTGQMRLDIQTARQAKQKLSAEQEAALKGKQKALPQTSAVGQWHELEITITGSELAVVLDGKPVGSLSSPGIAHPTKRQLRLAVPRNAVVDDLRVWRVDAGS